MSLRIPSHTTLDRYGLTLAEWKKFIPLGICPVCETVPASGRFVVDHEHVAGWKRMPSEERKKYVRGVCCTTCNHFVLTRYGTPLKFRNAALYLQKYLNRRPK